MGSRINSSDVVGTEGDLETGLASEHVFVGIDIGYTFTGVAICSTDKTPTEPIKPIPIQTWHGGDTTGSKVSNKVPTVVAFKGGDFRAQSWGFSCPSPRQAGSGTTVIKLFKFLLDKEYLSDVNKEKSQDDQESIHNVRNWFTGFLTKLRDHIISILGDPSWNVDLSSTKVEYIFSLPTSWEHNDALVEDFRGIIKEAGFGSEPNGSVSNELTEGVAAAVCTAKSVNHKFNEGDILLVCDAGGGTTDICVLRVVTIDRKTVELETLEQTSIFVGSVQIDEAFAEMFKNKLGDKRLKQPNLFHDFEVKDSVAQEVAEGEFQQIKVNWGTSLTLTTTDAKFSVPGLPDNERVEFPNHEINDLFDIQIRQIITATDRVLENIQQLQPEQKVSRLILSGGLGSSKYVQDKLETYYEPRGIQILYDKDPKEPPLAVCKGLVLDGMQRLLFGTPVLRTRRCRASYGIMRDEAYNKTKHKNGKTYISPRDGKKHVSRIQWFIKKGDIVRENSPITFERTPIASFGGVDTDWEDTIVTSKLPPGCVPDYWDKEACRIACRIQSNWEPDTLPSKRKYWVFGKKVLCGKFEISWSLEQENLKFEALINGMPVGEVQATQVPWTFTQDE